jgi:hypothetical protein
MQYNRELVRSAARAACFDSVAPSARVTKNLLHRQYEKRLDALAKGYPEFDPDQARGSDGQWTAGGGGGGSGPAKPSGESGWRRAGKYAAVAGALVAAAGIGVLAAPHAIRLARAVGLRAAPMSAKLRETKAAHAAMVRARAKAADIRSFYMERLNTASNRADLKDAKAQIKRYTDLHRQFSREADKLARQARAMRSRKRATTVAKGYPEYNEDQPRGEDGRWGGGGGGSSNSAAASGTANEPKTKRDWSRVTAVATDVALIAGTIALTGPTGAGAMGTALGARGIAGLARTSIGRTAMAATAAMTASRAWSVTVEPMLKHVGKLYGVAGLAAAFDAYKAMGGQVPSGATVGKLAARYGISAAGQRLAAAGRQITAAVKEAVSAAKRYLRFAGVRKPAFA